MEGSTTGALRPADDPGWSSYAETILVFPGSAPGEVPLSKPIGEEGRAVFAAAGLPGAFGVLTAENPYGRPADPTENVRRREQLLDELRAAGASPVQVEGVSPDRRHREIGVALRWPRDAVVELARRWEQSAIYWFDGQDMWVVGALTVAAPWKLEPR